ncbi:hypothetical protein FACS1894174_06620 [Bacteroidia bacterium]|nr:hypothetical protein FACS1894203_1790 [Bacteroidia bacterium]GHV22250.1 hypothetical protein FACS1894174_06620 [Bacteroidia bacterium]
MEIQFPEIIDTDHPERYIFTLKVELDLFSFSLYDPVVDNSYFYYEIPVERDSDAFSSFKRFFFENPFLTSSFRKIYILNGYPEFTFVPELLYKEDEAKSFVEFNFIDSTGKILSQKLRYPEIVIIHKLSEEIYRFLNRSFVDARFIHRISSIITYYQSKVKEINASQLIINLRNKQLDIICFSRGSFVFGNCFEINQLQDAVYYVLFTWKQLRLDQIKDYVYVSGDKYEKVKLMKEIVSYIHNIIPVNFPATAHFREVDIQNIPVEFACLTLCEL